MTPAERSLALDCLPPADRLALHAALRDVRRAWPGIAGSDLVAAAGVTLELLLIAAGTLPVLEELRHAA